MQSVSPPIEALTGSLSPAAARLVERFERSLPDVAQQAAKIIVAEIPAYAAQADAAFVDDVRANAQRALEVMVRWLRGAQPADDDFDFVRAPMSRRARRGFSVGDYLHAYRIGLRIAWDAIASGVEGDRSRDGALSLAGPVMQFIDLSSTLVGAAFGEVEHMLAATGERVRRDVLEDLLAGRVPTAGARADVVEAAGLGPEQSHVVISSRPETSGAADDHVLFAAARALGRVGAQAVAPLSVLRDDEVVVILPVEGEPAVSLAGALAVAQRKLSDQGTALLIGTSTIVDGLLALPTAYQEARYARSLATRDDPVSCLFERTVLDYLTMTADATAERLIRRQIREFVETDLDEGGVLTMSLLAYVDADLNVKAASARLFVHVNTAHARLARIAQRTGCDLRRLDDVNELRIAIESARRRR